MKTDATDNWPEDASVDRAVHKPTTRGERAWLAENKSAIEAHNKRIDEHGTLIKPIWMKKDD